MSIRGMLWVTVALMASFVLSPEPLAERVYQAPVSPSVTSALVSARGTMLTHNADLQFVPKLGEYALLATGWACILILFRRYGNNC